MTCSNLYYVLRKFESHNKAISELNSLSKIIRILKVEEQTFKNAVASEFPYLEDSIQYFSAIGNRKIDCIITSPPYPNEKDYTRSTRLESVILGFIKDKTDLRMMKENLLRSNSRNIFVNDSDGNYVKSFDSIEKIAYEIEDKRIKLKKSSGFERQYHKIVRHYFGGMFLHLKSLKPFLSTNAKLAYVVGDQMSFFQTHIPTADLLGEIAESLGYRVSEIELWRTRIATATKLQINENVLVLENM